MQPLWIRTRKYLLTKMTANDYDDYYHLSTNANVMKFVTGYALDRHESDERVMDILNDPESIGYRGKYLIREAKTGKLIGLAKIEQYGREIEVGYRILEEYWGQGIATAITRRLINFSLFYLNTKTVCAFVDIRNHASIRVLEKAGMSRQEEIEDVLETRYKFSYTPTSKLYRLKLFFNNLPWYRLIPGILPLTLLLF